MPILGSDEMSVSPTSYSAPALPANLSEPTALKLEIQSLGRQLTFWAESLDTILSQITSPPS